MLYSQYGEDQFLNEKYFLNMRNGTYIELGALDGVKYSNTKFFEDTLGWTGILIEPHKLEFESLQKNRPNNFLFNSLVSSEFYNNNRLQQLEQTTIVSQPQSLSEIVRSTNLKHIDLLSLDIDSHEYDVLSSWDFSVPINLILINMLGVDLQRRQKCRELLTNNGYKLDCVFKHNKIYMLHDFLQK